jgi:hypothetical protein
MLEATYFENGYGSPVLLICGDEIYLFNMRLDFVNHKQKRKRRICDGLGKWAPFGHPDLNGVTLGGWNNPVGQFENDRFYPKNFGKGKKVRVKFLRKKGNGMICLEILCGEDRWKDVVLDPEFVRNNNRLFFVASVVQDLAKWILVDQNELIDGDQEYECTSTNAAEAICTATGCIGLLSNKKIFAKTFVSTENFVRHENSVTTDCTTLLEKKAEFEGKEYVSEKQVMLQSVMPGLGYVGVGLFHPETKELEVPKFFAREVCIEPCCFLGTTGFWMDDVYVEMEPLPMPEDLSDLVLNNLSQKSNDT